MTPEAERAFANLKTIDEVVERLRLKNIGVRNVSGKIFLVMSEGGNGTYETKYSYVVKAWSTYAGAERHCIELFFEQARRVYAEERQEEFKRKWYEENPSTFESPVRRNYPTWAGIHNDQITQEMRDERQAIIKANNDQTALLNQYLTERERLCQNACNEYLESIGLSLDMLIHLNERISYYNYGSNKSEYKIKEVEFD